MATQLETLPMSAPTRSEPRVSRLPSRSEETDVWALSTLAAAALHAVILVPIVVYGAQLVAADKPLEHRHTAASQATTAVRVKLSDFDKPKPEPKPVAQVIVPETKPAPAPVPAKVAETKPEPKKITKQVKRRPARKTNKLRKKRVHRLFDDAPDGRAQRLLSKGDKPAPDGPSPSDLELAGSGAVGDGPPTAPGAGRTDGKKLGVGHQPASPTPATTPPKPVVDVDKLLRKYLRRVAKAVRKDFAYPRAALRAGMEGKVVVSITIDATGRVIAAKLSRSSGYDVLDRAAVAAAKSINRVPMAPTELRWQKRKVKIPFKFRLRS